MTPSSSLNRAANGWSGKLVHVSDFMEFLNYQVQTWLWKADIIVLQRNVIHPRIFDAMQYWQGMGKPVVIDLDDAYHFLPYSNPARPFWFERPHITPDDLTNETPGGAIKMLEEGLRLSNGLMAPNRLLLSDWHYVSGHSYYLQNFAEPVWWGVPPPGAEVEDDGQKWAWVDVAGAKQELEYRDRDGNKTGLPTRQQQKEKLGLDGKIVIGWGGSLSHYDSFWGSGIMDAIPKVTARHPDVVWMICGAEQRLYDQLPVAKVNKLHHFGVPPQQWPRVVSTFDIGLAPLSGVYDQRRSWIKGLEYSLAGTPWIATDGETYGDLKGWEAGLLGQGADFWEDSLEKMITNLERWQGKASGLVPEAQNRFIADNNIDTFWDVFTQVGTDFETPRVTLPNVIRITGESNGKTEGESEEAGAATGRADEVELTPDAVN